MTMTTARRMRCSVSLNTIAFPDLSLEPTQARNGTVIFTVILDTGDGAEGTMSGITGGRDRGHGGGRRVEFRFGNWLWGRGIPPPPWPCGIITLAGNREIIYGAQSVTGKILSRRELGAV